MSEHNRKIDAKETKSAKPQHEEEKQSQSNPANAYQNVTNAPFSIQRSADILTLQQTVGNQAVQRLIAERRKPTPQGIAPISGVIQRHPADTEKISSLSANQRRIESYQDNFSRSMIKFHNQHLDRFQEKGTAIKKNSSDINQVKLRAQVNMNQIANLKARGQGEE
jgi:hypothetical protein